MTAVDTDARTPWYKRVVGDNIMPWMLGIVALILGIAAYFFFGGLAAVMIVAVLVLGFLAYLMWGGVAAVVTGVVMALIIIGVGTGVIKFPGNAGTAPAVAATSPGVSNQVFEALLQNTRSGTLTTEAALALAKSGFLSVEQHEKLLAELGKMGKRIDGLEISDEKLKALVAEAEKYKNGAEAANAAANDLLKKFQELGVKPIGPTSALPPAAPAAGTPPKDLAMILPPPPAGATPPAVHTGFVSDGHGGGWWKGTYFSSCRLAVDAAILAGLPEPCEMPVYVAAVDFNTNCTTHGGTSYTAEEWNKKGKVPHLQPGQLHCTW